MRKLDIFVNIIFLIGIIAFVLSVAGVIIKMAVGATGYHWSSWLIMISMCVFAVSFLSVVIIETIRK